MAKKILCVVLLVLSIVCAFTSCDDDTEETPAHTHEFGEWETTKAATCKEAGTQTRFCDCGESQTKDVAKTTVHTWIDATYEAPKTCSVCAMTEGTPLVPEHTHSFGEWETTKAATCKEAGTQTRFCDCGESQTKDVAKTTVHTWIDATYEAPKTCSVCAITEGTPLVPTHTHSYGEWETTKAATCTEEGSKERYCPCGEKQTATISMTEHTYGDWTIIKPATTTEAGIEERACSCGKKETRDIDMIPIVTTVTEEQWKTAFDLSKYVSFTVTGAENGSEDGVDFDFDATIKYYGGLIYIKLDGMGYNGENDFVKYESTAIESFSDLHVEGFGQLRRLLRDFEELNDFGYSRITYSADTKAYTTIDEDGCIYKFGFEDGKLVKFSYEDNGQEEFLFAEYTFSDINTTQKTDMPLAVIIAEYNEIVNAISSSDKFYYYDEENWTKVYYDTAELKALLSSVEITKVEEYEKGTYETCLDWYVETYSGSSSNPSVCLEVREGEIYELSINSQSIYIE